MTTPSRIAPAQHLQLASLPLDRVFPDPNQDRKHFDPDELQDLADSLRAQGLLQPITVRISGADRYEIIGGERRWRAAQLAGMTHIDAVVRLDVQPGQQHALQLIENLQRADLTLPEQMAGVGRLVDDIGLAAAVEALGKGKKDKTWVSRVANLRTLWAPARALVESGHITSPDLAHELHKLASMGDDGRKAADTLVGYFTNPPAHRLHTPTREEVRGAIKLQADIRSARQSAEQEKADKAKREIATDNQRGYDSTADDAPATRAKPGIDKAAEVRAQAQRIAADEAERAERAQAREEKRDQRERLLAACLGFTRLDNQGKATYLWDDAEVELHLDAREHGSDVTYSLTLDGLSALDVERLAAHLSQRRATPSASLPAGVNEADLAPVREFLRLHTRPCPGAHIRASWLQDQFAEWRAQQGQEAIPRPRVAALIEACGVATKRLETGKTYRDITPAGTAQNGD